VEKVVGGCAVLGCFFLGGFLALASFAALLAGEDEFYLYGLALVGVGLLVGGVVMLFGLFRSRPPKNQTEMDEAW
jgi:hypothetical protein